MSELLAFEPWMLLLLVLVAFLAGVIHGLLGLAGGLIMAAIFSHFFGVKATVIIVTCALSISHLSRGVLFKQNTNWWVVRHVLLFGTPTIILGAFIFGYLSQTAVALFFGTVLLVSIPIKYLSKCRSLQTGPKLLATASLFWGMLAGNVIGPGFFLTPFLLGTGMNRLTFVGTLAIITLAMNLIKLSVLSLTGLVNFDLVVLGIIAGIATVPGNMLGRVILKQINDGIHGKLIDIMTLTLVVNFFCLALD